MVGQIIDIHKVPHREPNKFLTCERELYREKKYLKVNI